MQTIVLLQPPVMPQPVVKVSRHEPWIHNGEQELSKMLERLGIDHEYETRFYEFGYHNPLTDSFTQGGFNPDFYLPGTHDRPSLNIELTLADCFRPSMTKRDCTYNLKRIQAKRVKIQHTQQVYGVETILVTYRIFRILRQNPVQLQRLIRKASSRHARHERQRYPQCAYAA